MRYDPDRHHRRSIRLSGYDYSQPGAYFITICTRERACLFGEVADGEIRLNEAGQMILAEWNALTARFPAIQLDAFVVMPNHVHGIFMITTNVSGATTRVAPTVGETTVGNAMVARVVGVASSGHGPMPDQHDNSDVGAGLVPAQSRPTTAAETAKRATTKRATTRVAPTVGDNTAGETTVGKTTVGDVVAAFKSRTTVLYIRGIKKRGWAPFAGRLWQRNYYEHIIRDESSLQEIRQYIADNPMRWHLDLENPDFTTSAGAAHNTGATHWADATASHTGGQP